MDAMNSGHYTVTVTAPGFEIASTHNLNVPSSVVTTYDPVMTVGEVSQAVTVRSEFEQYQYGEWPVIEHGRHGGAFEDSGVYVESD